MLAVSKFYACVGAAVDGFKFVKENIVANEICPSFSIEAPLHPVSNILNLQKYRVCVTHARSLAVPVGGVISRFCQKVTTLLVV